MEAYEEELTQLKAELYDIMEKALDNGNFQTIKTTGSEKIPYVREDAARVIHLISRKAQIESALRGEFVPPSTPTETENKGEKITPNQAPNSEMPSVPLEQPQDNEAVQTTTVEMETPNEPIPSANEPAAGPIQEPVVENSPDPTLVSPSEPNINQPEQPQPIPENNQPIPTETDDIGVSYFNNLDYQKMAFSLALLRRMQPILPSITDEKARTLLEQEIIKQSEIVKQARSVLPVNIQREVEQLAMKDTDISEMSPAFNEYITENAETYENAYKLYEVMDPHASEIKHLQEEKEKIYKTTSESDQQSASFKREIAQIDSFIEKEQAKRSNVKELCQLLALSSTADLFFNKSEEKPKEDLPNPEPQMEPETPTIEPVTPVSTSEKPSPTVDDTKEPITTPVVDYNILKGDQLDEMDGYTDEDLDKLLADLRNAPEITHDPYETSDAMLDNTPVEFIVPADTYKVRSYHDAAQELLDKIPPLRVAKQFVMRVQDYVDGLLQKLIYTDENISEDLPEEYSEIEGVSYYELFDTVQDWMNEFNTDVQVSPEQVNNYISRQVSFSKPGQSLDDFEREDVPSSDDYSLIVIDPETIEDTESIEIRPEIENSSVHKTSDGPVYAHIPNHILQLVEQRRETEDYTQGRSVK